MRVRHLTACAGVVLAWAASTWALPPQQPGTPAPGPSPALTPKPVPPPPPPPPTRLPSPNNPVLWIQCPFYYVPTNVGTAAAVSFATAGGTPAQNVNGRTLPGRLPTGLDVARYADAASVQFAAVLNRMPEGCTVTLFSKMLGKHYEQIVYSGAHLVEISSFAGANQQPRETLRFNFRTYAVREQSIP
jgi:hypothetical protein